MKEDFWTVVYMPMSSASMYYGQDETKDEIVYHSKHHRLVLYYTCKMEDYFLLTNVLLHCHWSLVLAIVLVSSILFFCMSLSVGM